MVQKLEDQEIVNSFSWFKGGEDKMSGRHRGQESVQNEFLLFLTAVFVILIICGLAWFLL